MKTLLRMEPVFQEKIWGGSRLKTEFQYPIPSEKTGECWAISGHPNGESRLKNPEFAGETLGSLWKTRRELFGNLPGDTFPLLVKILDAKQDLSIQVHPDDAYAQVHENGSLGKTECWYILDCDPNSTIVYGHNAKTREEMEEMAKQGRWTELLRQVPVKKGDFFQVNPGCIHALRAGTFVLETQQSSDVTYRFYDYGRLQNGKPRPLHMEQSLAVARIPFRMETPEPEARELGDARVTRLIQCPYYTVCHVELDGRWKTEWTQPFVNVSVLSGRGTMDGEGIEKGDHLIIPAGYGKMEIRGSLELIYSHV